MRKGAFVILPWQILELSPGGERQLKHAGEVFRRWKSCKGELNKKTSTQILYFNVRVCTLRVIKSKRGNDFIHISFKKKKKKLVSWRFSFCQPTISPTFPSTAPHRPEVHASSYQRCDSEPQKAFEGLMYPGWFDSGVKDSVFFLVFSGCWFWYSLVWLVWLVGLSVAFSSFLDDLFLGFVKARSPGPVESPLRVPGAHRGHTGSLWGLDAWTLDRLVQKHWLLLLLGIGLYLKGLSKAS